MEKDIDNNPVFTCVFVPSGKSRVKKALELAELKPGQVFYEIGCGKANTLIRAVKRHGAKGVGIEMNMHRAKVSKNKVKKHLLEKSIEIRNMDAGKVTDYSKADVIYFYLITSANEMLKPILEKQLKVGTKIISLSFPIPGWKEIKKVDGFYVYEFGKH